MKDLLVGSTGFVGGNLMRSHPFEAACHSSDIHQYYRTNPELCIYAGVPAAMFLANNDPEKDLEIMRQARENIRKINPQKVVLISSIAVYQNSKGKDENSEMNTEGLPAYGRNRLQLEQWIREDYPDALIVRLPALYGYGLKKNFLFDLHTIIPSMLKPEKYLELQAKSMLIQDAYSLKDNGFYCLIPDFNKKELKNFFSANDFNALSFTDSRSKYQFYSLTRLWQDICVSLSRQLRLVNLCTPPVSANTVYRVMTGKEWSNELPKEPFDYDLRSIYADLLGGKDGYLCNEEEELRDIKHFMDNWEE